MEEFLNFCDTKVQLDTRIPPVYGTRFTRNKTYPIKFPNRVMGVGVFVDEAGVPKSKQKYRKINNQFAKNERVRRTTLALVKAMDAEKAVKGAKRRELEKTVKFWENVFLNKKFTDKKMFPEDKGLWGGKKYIDSVFKNDQIYVGYAPDIRKAARSGGDSAKQEQVNNASG